MKSKRFTHLRLDKQERLEILENALSWIVVFAMLVYGGAKYLQFEGAAEVNTPLSSLTPMQLMWAFYGYSKPFAITLGVFEIIGGLLILIKKTRIIGCLFTSSILVNIILQDIFFSVNEGALRAAIIYQSLILIILYLNRKKLIQGIQTILLSSKSEPSKKRVFIKFAIAFLLFIVFRMMEFYLTAF
ncbi:MAG: hypothetical protein RIC95_05355 [Vicingaceae bacterium]